LLFSFDIAAFRQDALFREHKLIPDAVNLTANAALCANDACNTLNAFFVRCASFARVSADLARRHSGFLYGLLLLCGLIAAASSSGLRLAVVVQRVKAVALTAILVLRITCVLTFDDTILSH
jgi:hypothetical protein